jgi:hypothetical protein
MHSKGLGELSATITGIRITLVNLLLAPRISGRSVIYVTLSLLVDDFLQESVVDE